MRGYGDSDKPGTLEDYKMPCLVNDIKEIIEALGTYISTQSVSAVQQKPFIYYKEKLTAECKILYLIRFLIIKRFTVDITVAPYGKTV